MPGHHLVPLHLVHGLGVLHLDDGQDDGLDRELPPSPGGEQLDGLHGPVRGERGQQHHLARLGQELVGQELVSQVRDVHLPGARLWLGVAGGDVGHAVGGGARGEGVHGDQACHGGRQVHWAGGGAGGLGGSLVAGGDLSRGGGGRRIVRRGVREQTRWGELGDGDVGTWWCGRYWWWRRCLR